jgi:probable rRNA maturation factor
MPVDAASLNVTLELNSSSDLPLPDQISDASLHSLILSALVEEQASGQWEIGLLFTSDATIQDMHRQFMDLDSPTDIMTFPYEGDEFSPASAVTQGGDIVISVETAALHADEVGWSVGDELEFLVLHGLLHILGWDDPDPDRRAAMLARQSVLLSAWRQEFVRN